MALKTKSIRGTRDVVPRQSYKWQYVERVALETAARYGIAEIRIPTIEKTELFVRSVGETTDVVQKEMYTFEKGRESITLRPEGTAGTVRAVLENNLLAAGLPVTAAYILSCFRHENPQAGRLREFHQFGVEYFGCPLPTADAELIGLVHEILSTLGIHDVALHINSIGCPQCRPGYNKALTDYYRANSASLCKDCLGRLEKNPLRLLDCKEPACSALAKKAPVITDFLCEECSEHFDGLRTRLDAMGLAYEVDPYIVRGLDYYTKTVFEFISQNIGAQGTVCGGGRYDGLVEQMGGPATPALGFGMGLERLLMVMEALGCPFPAEPKVHLYIGSRGEAANIRALALATQLRKAGFCVLCDTVGRSVKAQMKYADKTDATFSCVLGDDELANSRVTLRNMHTGETAELPLEHAALADWLQVQTSPEQSELYRPTGRKGE